MDADEGRYLIFIFIFLVFSRFPQCFGGLVEGLERERGGGGELGAGKLIPFQVI